MKPGNRQIDVPVTYDLRRCQFLQSCLALADERTRKHLFLRLSVLRQKALFI